MNSEFKGYGRAEPLLEEYLPKFDKLLTQRMLVETNALKDQLQRFVITTEPPSFTIKDFHRETAYWTITFSQPVIQYVPECFRFITKNFRYHYEKGQWLEHVPSYISNINHVTMNTLYNHRNNEFTNNTDGIIKKYIFEKNTPMTFYSFNTLLKWHAIKKSLDESAHDIIKKCFEVCYWRLPTPFIPNHDDGSCINNLIYASTSKVLEILILRKTLVKILEIDGRIQTRTLLENTIRGRFAKVLMISDDGVQIVTQQKSIFLLEHIADSLGEQDVVNGVLVQIGTREKRKGMVMIGQIGEMVKPENLETVISLIMSRLMQNIEDYSSPTKITTISNLEFETTKIIQSNPRFFEGMLGWGKDLPKKISNAVEKLFPLFFENDGEILHIPPSIMTFIATSASKYLENKKFLLLIAAYFDTLQINANTWGERPKTKLRLSDNYEEIQNDFTPFANTLLNVTPRLINRIIYSRTLSQDYTHQG